MPQRRQYRKAKATAEEIESKSAVAYVLSGLGMCTKTAEIWPSLAHRMKVH